MPDGICASWEGVEIRATDTEDVLVCDTSAGFEEDSDVIACAGARLSVERPAPERDGPLAGSTVIAAELWLSADEADALAAALTAAALQLREHVCVGTVWADGEA